MLNLLPTKEKQEIQKQTLIRAVIVFVVAATLVFATGAVLLAPSALLVAVKEKSERAQITALEKSMIVLADKETLLESTRATDRKLAILEKNDFLEISPLATAVLGHKDFGVRITGFLYEKADDKRGIPEKFVVEGVSLSREALVSFARALEADILFADVELPVGNLVQSRDIPFSLAMNITIESRK